MRTEDPQEFPNAGDLIRQSGIVHRVGRLTLAAGHGSYRVKSHMRRVGRAVGLEDVEAQVALTEITTTVVSEAGLRTEVSELRTVGINADRLAELESYISSLPYDEDEDQIAMDLDRIATKPPLYPAWFNALSAGIACAAFAFLNGGRAVVCALVLVAATIGQYLRRDLILRGINQFGVTMLAAAVTSSIYLGLVAAGGMAVGLGEQHAAGYVSAVLFLVPGFPLVTGALDLARLDLSAGVSRLTYALMILASGALALSVVSEVTGLRPGPIEGGGMSLMVWWALLALASFAGVLGFALMFNSPLHMAMGAAGVGMIANVLRLALVDLLHWTPQGAAAIAALLVGVLARVIAGPLRVPRLTISVPAVVIMVPGIAAYRAVFELNAGRSSIALGFAADAALVVIALAIGLAAARMLTDREWTFEQR